MENKYQFKNKRVTEQRVTTPNKIKKQNIGRFSFVKRWEMLVEQKQKPTPGSKPPFCDPLE